MSTANDFETNLPRCPVTGEIKPHRNAQGEDTFKVRVIRIGDV